MDSNATILISPLESHTTSFITGPIQLLVVGNISIKINDSFIIGTFHFLQRGRKRPPARRKRVPRGTGRFSPAGDRSPSAAGLLSALANGSGGIAIPEKRAETAPTGSRASHPRSSTDYRQPAASGGRRGELAARSTDGSRPRGAASDGG